MFDNVIGHEEVKKHLISVINSNNISHSYLFEGKEKIGKCTVAKEFAKQILGVNTLESSPDYKYISKKEDKKDISVEQIRKGLIDDVYIAPAVSKKKIYIIDDAQNLNISAQNALLKTLEEPPHYVVIILISNSLSAFLPTVLSRINKLSFSGIKKEEITSYIKMKYDKKIGNELLEYIDGSLGLAIDIIENNEKENFEKVERIYNNIVNKDYIEVSLELKNIELSNTKYMNYLSTLFYINNKLFAIKYIEKAINRLKYNGNYDIVINSMIINIINNI